MKKTKHRLAYRRLNQKIKKKLLMDGFIQDMHERTELMDSITGFNSSKGERGYSPKKREFTDRSIPRIVSGWSI